MALNKIIPKFDLDIRLTVFTLFGQFSGRVWETNYQETSLTLHTSKGVMYFDLPTIMAVRLEPDQQF